MGVKEWTPGDIRYLTYYLIFPHDRDIWQDQITILHDLQFEMTRWAFIKKDPKRANELLTRGETHWKDDHGVTHRVVIESTKRNRRWGLPKQKLQLARGH